METRQLRYFVAVARTRHFGRAAEQLHIAQSPLSQAIRQLEGQLGAPLFERTTRRVDLTPAGEALLPDAVRILASVDAARDQVRHVAAGALGRIRVGATGLATYRHVPDIVRRLTAELPGLALTFTTEMLTPSLEAALADHRVDLAVLRPPVGNRDLDQHVLVQAADDGDGHGDLRGGRADGPLILALRRPPGPRGRSRGPRDGPTAAARTR